MLLYRFALQMNPQENQKAPMFNRDAAMAVLVVITMAVLVVIMVDLMEVG